MQPSTSFFIRCWIFLTFWLHVICILWIIRTVPWNVSSTCHVSPSILPPCLTITLVNICVNFWRQISTITETVLYQAETSIISRFRWVSQLIDLVKYGSISTLCCWPGALRTFAPIATAHPYSAPKFTCHVMHRAPALSTKMNNDRADGNCYSFAWI